MDKMDSMTFNEKVEYLGNLMLEVYDETRKCIKAAETETEKLKVRALLNAIASYHGGLEDDYRHPENIIYIKHE